MLDMTTFREHADVIRADHTKRGLAHDNIDRVIELDRAWRNLLHETDQLRRAKNEAARGIGAAKKSGDHEAAEAILAQVADLGQQIAEMEAKTNEAMSVRDRLRMSIPNILHDDVPVGEDDAGNTVHAVQGTKPEFSFEPRTHNELIEMNKWVDLKRAAKITGSRFYFLKGDLLDLNSLSAVCGGFPATGRLHFVQPPVMMNRQAYEGVTVERFETVMYGIEPDKYYMIATSEHPLTAMYMDETIPKTRCPCAWSVSPSVSAERWEHGQSDLGIGECISSPRLNKSSSQSPKILGRCMKNCSRTAWTCGTALASTMKWSTFARVIWARWLRRNTTSKRGSPALISTRRSSRAPTAPTTRPTG